MIEWMLLILFLVGWIGSTVYLRKRKAPMPAGLGFIVACAAVAVFGLIDAWFKKDPSKQQPIEQVVAIADAGDYVRGDDIRVKRVAYLLRSLELSTGYDKQAIVAKVQEVRAYARERFGRDLAITEILEAANKSEVVRRHEAPLEAYLASYVYAAGR